MYLIVSVRMSTCVNVYMNIYTHMRTTVYVSLSYVCVCVCIYVSLYIYIYIIVYLPTHNSLFLQDGTHTASGVLKEAAILFNTSALASREDMAKGMTSFSF